MKLSSPCDSKVGIVYSTSEKNKIIQHQNRYKRIESQLHIKPKSKGPTSPERQGIYVTCAKKFPNSGSVAKKYLF